LGVTLFKNVSGLFYTKDGRPIKAGMMNGFSDLCGWKTVKITSDMVGKELAVFVAIEVKTPTGKIRPEQKIFIETVKERGGIAGVCRSVEEAEKLVGV
jgi:hypothetical protein